MEDFIKIGVGAFFGAIGCFGLLLFLGIRRELKRPKSVKTQNSIENISEKIVAVKINGKTGEKTVID